MSASVLSFVATYTLVGVLLVASSLSTERGRLLVERSRHPKVVVFVAYASAMLFWPLQLVIQYVILRRERDVRDRERGGP